MEKNNENFAAIITEINKRISNYELDGRYEASLALRRIKDYISEVAYGKY